MTTKSETKSETTAVNATAPRSLNSALALWLADGRPVAEATVIDATGAAPVPIGGRMIIASEDDFQGSVSGGCVEADVIAAALDVIASGKPETMTFGIADEVAWRSGLPCGSTIHVYVQPVTAQSAATLSDAMLAISRDRQPRVVETRLSDGQRTLYDHGHDAPADVVDALTSGISRRVSRGDSEAFLHALTPPPRIVVIGATHVAQILQYMASAIGYDVVIIDPRSAFTSATRFDQDPAITGWPEATLAAFASDPFTAIVTLTHIGHIDDDAIKIALRLNNRYIGALGSRRTHAARLTRLKAAGFDDSELARIHAPVGLDLGGRTPGEIAVAILGEIVAAFNGKLSE
ncbi:MAG TPA: XdhC family protein [Hyphomicrobium sp.]|nr:XdhC family protein [Hyphomicrobium sp.]